MSSFLEEYHFAVVDFLLVLSFFIKCELNIIPNNYMHSWTNKYMRQMIKQWLKHKWSHNTVHQFWKILLAKTWGTRQEQTTKVLRFRIKLKKVCNKNACVYLCCIAEVAKPSSKMTLWCPKIAAMWHSCK